MVEKNGEKKPRSSRSRRSHKVPKSVRWKKNLTSTPTASSHGIKKLTCSFNCTEKLSSILMCQKGYASLAFYAIFALFILAFIYTLWKIVSANTSRSGQNRRPETSSKVSPTAKTPTWSEDDEEELKKFFPTITDFPSSAIEETKKPTEAPPAVTLPPSTSPIQLQDFPTQPLLQTVNRLRGPVFGEDVSQPYQENRQSPIIGEDYMPIDSPFNSKWPPRNMQPPPWQSLERGQRPWALRQRRPQISLMRDGGLQGQYFKDRGRFSFGEAKTNAVTSNGLSRSDVPSFDKEYGIKDNENSETRDEYRTNLHLKDKNPQSNDMISHSHHSHHHLHHHSKLKDDDVRKLKGDDVHVRNEMQRNYDELELGVPVHHKKNYLRNHIMRPHKSSKHRSDQSLGLHQHRKYEETNDEESDKEDESDQHNRNHNNHQHHLTHRHHHRQIKENEQNHHHHSKPTQHQPQREHHHHHHIHHTEDIQKHRHHHTKHDTRALRHHHKHNNIKDDNSDHYQHHDHQQHHYHHHHLHHHTQHDDHQHLKQNHHNQHQHHHQHHNQHHNQHQHDHHHHENQHQQHHHHRKQSNVDTNSDGKKNVRSKIPHHVKHKNKEEKHKHGTHAEQEEEQIAKTKNVKHLHHILDFKHYMNYKKHHSVDEEVHGQWKGIKKKIKDCVKMKTFSANGKVLLTRTSYREKYLYTVLVCNVVHIRKHRKHSKHSSYKKTQLCYKLYFVTKAALQVNRTKDSKTTEEAAEYEVNACRPSKAHYHSVAFKGVLAKKHHIQKKKSKKQFHRDEIPKPGKKSHHKKKTKKTMHKGKHLNNQLKHTAKITKHSHTIHTHSTKDKHKKKSPKVKKGHHSKDSNKNEDAFFNKLLNVLSIVNKNKGTANATTPLSNLKGALQKMKKAKEEAKRKKKQNHKKPSKKHTKKHAKKTKEIDISSPAYINKLLSKILPAVVSNVRNEIKGKSEVKNSQNSKTTSTTTPTPTTTSSTTPSTTTHPTTTPSTTTPPTTTPTTKTTPRPTTKAKGIEDELKDVLPLLLKKMQLAKQTTTPKPTTKPTTQEKSKVINDLLARLGLAGADVRPASKPTREVKTLAMPSHSNPTITERLNDLTPLVASSPSLPPPPPSFPMDQPARNQPILGNDPYAKHILCFGDSLTNGYYNHGHNFHPYSVKLKQLLNSNSQIQYDFVTSGKTGEMAHESMNNRLPQVLGNSSRFDWVIILAGTNDVAHVKNFGDDDSFMNQLIGIWSPKIFKDIITLHEDAYRYGSRTVLITIPESAYESWPQFKVLWIMRKRINQQLRKFAAQSQGRTVLCDLALKIPRHSLSPQLQKLFWSDHLHLTPFGYDKMAEIVYKCLKPYV